MRRLAMILISLTLVLALAAGGLAEARGALFGSPWVNSTVIGNLPETAPALKDDVYGRQLRRAGGQPVRLLLAAHGIRG